MNIYLPMAKAAAAVDVLDLFCETVAKKLNEERQKEK